MKGIIGVAAGAFAVCAVLVAYNVGGHRAPYFQASPYFETDSGLVPVRLDGSSMALTGGGGAMAVACEPYQHAIIQERVVAGERVTRVACVSVVGGAGNGSAGAPALYPQSPYSATSYPAGYVPATSYTPVREVVRTRPVASRQGAEPVSAPRRTWQKSALLIGGSAGAGAGVGGLLGGKKGALAGAAIGGGSAAIYDQVKRH